MKQIKLLVIGASSAVVENFLEKVSSTNVVLWLDIEAGTVKMNGKRMMLLHDVGSMMRLINKQLEVFTDCWVFDPGIHESKLRKKIDYIIRHIVFSTGNVLRYVNSFMSYHDLPILFKHIPNKTKLQWIISPLCLIFRDGENMTAYSGLLNDLKVVKMEVEKKVQDYWASNDFPLSKKASDQLFQVVELNDYTAFLADQVKKIPDAHRTICRLGTSSRSTIKQLITSIFNVTVKICPNVQNDSLAYLIDESLSAYFVRDYPNFVEEITRINFSFSFNDTDEIKFFGYQDRKRFAISDLLGQMKSKETVGDTGRIIRYFSGGSGEDTILIINALGLTIDFWTDSMELLMKHAKVIVWETRCCDLVRGGMEDVITIDEHSEDIKAILQKEQTDKCHLLAWCNGGRIAVVTASKLRNIIASIIFLSPVFKGIEYITPDDTKFEMDLDEVFRGVLKNNKMAGIFSKYIIKTKMGIQDRVKDNMEVLSFPDFAFRSAVLAPMQTGKALLNYAIRTQNDEGYSLYSLISELRLPVLFILGSNDNIISNKLAVAVAELFTHAGVILVNGASHYIHQQQPDIFSEIVMSFLLGRHTEISLKRVKILD